MGSCIARVQRQLLRVAGGLCRPWLLWLLRLCHPWHSHPVWLPPCCCAWCRNPTCRCRCCLLRLRRRYRCLLCRHSLRLELLLLLRLRHGRLLRLQGRHGCLRLQLLCGRGRRQLLLLRLRRLRLALLPLHVVHDLRGIEGASKGFEIRWS